MTGFRRRRTVHHNMYYRSMHVPCFAALSLFWLKHLTRWRGIGKYRLRRHRSFAQPGTGEAIASPTFTSVLLEPNPPVPGLTHSLELHSARFNAEVQGIVPHTWPCRPATKVCVPTLPLQCRPHLSACCFHLLSILFVRLTSSSMLGSAHYASLDTQIVVRLETKVVLRLQFNPTVRLCYFLESDVFVVSPMYPCV
jgi:hypothetical protein